MKRIFLSSLFCIFIHVYVLSQKPTQEQFQLLDECIAYCIDSSIIGTAELSPAPFNLKNYLRDYPKVQYKGKTYPFYLVIDGLPYWYFYKSEFFKDRDFPLIVVDYDIRHSISLKWKMRRILRKRTPCLFFEYFDFCHDTLQISFTFRYVQLNKRKRIGLSISDGIRFYYLYNPLLEKWVCIRKEEWGI